MNKIQKGIQQARAQISHLTQRLQLLPDTVMTQNMYSTYIDVIKYNMSNAESHLDSAVQSLNNQSRKKETKLPAIKSKSVHEKNVIEMKIFNERDRGGERGGERNRKSNQNVLRRNQVFMRKYEPLGQKQFVRNNSSFRQKSISTSFVEPDNRMYVIPYRQEKYIEELAKSSLMKQSIEIQQPELILSVMNGALITTTNEYNIFSYIYKSAMGKINEFIRQLGGMMNQSGIGRISLNGKALGNIVLVEQPLKYLLECILEPEIKQHLLTKYNKNNSQEVKSRAVTLIQSLWRMNLIRKEYMDFKEKVLIIQQFAKKYVAKRMLQRAINQKSQQKHNQFLERQEQLKLNYESITSLPRFQIHINSLIVHQGKRLSVQNIEEKNNIQLTRVFRLKDPNVSLIVIANVDKIQEVMRCYEGILGQLGIKYDGRLFFLAPENKKRFPRRFSLSKLLYYSPKCLANIKRIVKGRTCIFVPGYPCPEDIQICNEIGCYLLSSCPLKAKSLCSKYEQRKLFMAAQLPILPSISDFIEIGELTRAFCEIMVNNLGVETWLFKINNSTNSQGIASYTLPRSIISILNKIEEQQRRQKLTSNSFYKEKGLEPVELVHFKSIMSIVEQTLFPKLKIAIPSTYKTPEQFLKSFLKQGGVIEQYSQNSSSKSVSVCFFLLGSGKFQILSTYERLEGEPFVNVACKFPQEIVPHSVVTNCLEKLCGKLAESEGFGFYVLDMICTRRRNDSEYFIYMIGLDPYLNNYASSYFYFDALMNGRYQPEEKCYHIQVSQEIKRSLNSSFLSSSTKKKQPLTSSTQLRRYIYSPYVLYPNFQSTPLRSLQKILTLQNINYNFTTKEGIDTLFLDEAISGLFGFMAVFQDSPHLISSLQNSLAVIKKLFVRKKGNMIQKQSINKSQITINDLISACRRMSRNTKSLGV